MYPRCSSWFARITLALISVTFLPAPDSSAQRSSRRKLDPAPHAVERAPAGTGRYSPGYDSYKLALSAGVLDKPAEDALSRSKAGRQADVFLDAPFLQVRLADEPEFDGAIRVVAQRRIRSMLSEPLRIQDVHVFNFVRGTATEEAYRALPARARPASLAPLRAALQSDGLISAPDLRAGMAPLRGKVLFFVGHIESDGVLQRSNGNQRSTRISTEMLTNAAWDSGVELLILGCHSARYAPIGTVRTVNSLEAMNWVRRAVSAPIDDHFDLLKRYTSADNVHTFDLVTWDFPGRGGIKVTVADKIGHRGIEVRYVPTVATCDGGRYRNVLGEYRDGCF